AEQYKLLEEKLFALHEYEKGSNPIRSKLLQRAFTQSQEKIAKLTKNLGHEIENNECEANTEESIANKNSDSPKPQDATDPDEGTEKITEPEEGDAKENPAKEKPAEGHPHQPGEPQNGGESSGEKPDGANQQPDKKQNPTRKRIQSAEDRMRNAEKKLDDAKRDEAIEEMKKAEREMAAAKKELEEILRQLREEEIERTLAMLEGRFRKMLEREVRLLESTKKLNDIVPEQRATDFEIRAGKLSQTQASIATEAARALLLLREDGSSVAFPATVDEMHQDMLQVANRLSSAKVGRITIEIEEDIVDTLNYLVAALVQTQQDMERMKRQSQKGKAGNPGDKPLVDKLAEIKMLRGLQERIMRRHKRYARFLDDPDDPIGETDDPEVQAALDRLAEKQSKLTAIARDIVNEKNK
ncbi:MAG: hypothetical protein AB8B55_18785, partial [Mariniblastus sp.]